MKKDILLTILSPAYNKGKTIQRSFDSLLRQTCHDFEWLIVNDGSTDNTLSIIKEMKTSLFPIKIIDKKNEGLNRTFNRGVKEAKGKYILRLDPDDFLVDNAVEEVINEIRKYDGDESICSVAYLTKFNTGKIIGRNLLNKVTRTNFFDYRYKLKVKGDCCEIVRTDVLRKYPMPEIDGEKFCRESYIWFEIAQEYDAIYFPLAIYIREYNENSISSNSVKVYSQNPNGMMLCNAQNVKLLLKYKNKNKYIKDILRSGVNYYRFGLYSKRSLISIMKGLPPLVTLFSIIPGCIIYIIDRISPSFINRSLSFIRKIKHI